MMKKFLFRLGFYYFVFLTKTCRTTIVGREQVESEFKAGKSLVFCCPHNFLLGLFVGIESGKLQRPTITVVTSLSSDGELVAKLLSPFRFEIVRGSSNRGGKKALFELAKAGKQGKSLGIAFDGPKGPPLVPKRGLIGCARATGGDIYLIHGNAKPGRFLPFLKPFRVKSWDRFLVLVPFSKIEVVFEKVPPYQMPSNVPEGEQDKETENHILHFIETRSKEIYENLYSSPKLN
jgi:lysophospholipid acyltransferase (LPLAT)-like uncharacterized protein